MLDQAIKIASQLQNRKQRICSIITDRKGRILGIGTNSYTKTHPRQAFYATKCNDFHKIFLHSEIDALVNCKQKPETIYIARVNHKGEPLRVSPCPICQLAINDAKIKNVITT